VLLNNNTFIEETAGRQFRIVFEVLIDFNGYHSYADIAIYNLRESTRQNIVKKGAIIGLRAGYADSIDFIFNGQIRNVFSERTGPDTITRVIAHGAPPPTKSINQTIGKGVSVPTLIRACASIIGLPLVINDDDFNASVTYSRGYSLYGDPMKILDKLANTHGFSYVIENRRIVVVGKNSFRAGIPYVISQANGMEGIPEITEVGVDANVRLTPKIRIGGQVDVQSKLATFNFSNLYFQNVPANAGSGVYNVQRLKYSGDSWGDTWTTSVTGFRPTVG
jgi:hypothetical protein